MKYPAQDVTFIIPVQVDHPDRVQNLQTTVAFLLKYFDCKILIMENMPKNGEAFLAVDKAADFDFCRHSHFHRTRMLNDMTRAANTPIVFNWDADVVVPPAQIEAAIQVLRNGADIAYPFSGVHECVERADAVKFWQSLDTKDLANKRHRNWDNPIKSVGGCLGYRVDSYWRVGGENENFISYGPEDSERWHRYKTLGLKVVRIGGSLYHIEHFKGPNSSTANPHFAANNREWERIKRMSRQHLENEIKTWSWAKKVS